jgi:hypothetical protein
MDDVSITFTSGELAELQRWLRGPAYGAHELDPTLVNKIGKADGHSQNPAHPPELTAAEAEPFWCMVRADSPDGPVEVQHWSGAYRRDQPES